MEMALVAGCAYLLYLAGIAFLAIFVAVLAGMTWKICADLVKTVSRVRFDRGDDAIWAGEDCSRSNVEKYETAVSLLKDRADTRPMLAFCLVKGEPRMMPGGALGGRLFGHDFGGLIFLDERMVSQLEGDEIVAVLAYGLVHLSDGNSLKALCLSIASISLLVSAPLVLIASYIWGSVPAWMFGAMLFGSLASMIAKNVWAYTGVYVADAGSALLSGTPEPLKEALRKIFDPELDPEQMKEKTKIRADLDSHHGFNLLKAKFILGIVMYYGAIFFLGLAHPSLKKRYRALDRLMV